MMDSQEKDLVTGKNEEVNIEEVNNQEETLTVDQVPAEPSDVETPADTDAPV